MKVYRCGQTNKSQSALKKEQLECLTGYWSWEEQMGLRKKPVDTLLDQIPKIKLNPVVTKGGSDESDRN